MRTSPPTFTKQLRADSEISEENEAAEKKPRAPSKRKPVDANSVLNELLARAKNTQDNAKPSPPTN